MIHCLEDGEKGGSTELQADQSHFVSCKVFTDKLDAYTECTFHIFLNNRNLNKGWRVGVLFKRPHKREKVDNKN